MERYGFCNSVKMTVKEKIDILSWKIHPMDIYEACVIASAGLGPG